MTGGAFVVFEGGEGAGKSTQVGRLAEALRRRGVDVVATREPGGTALGGRIRELLLGDGPPMSARAEALLFAAGRAQHVREVILPALNAGRVVICDRFAGSSIAYQGYGMGLGEAWIEQLSQWAAYDVEPTLTVLLDVVPQVGLARARARGDVNRFEEELLEFHGRIRASFQRQALRPGWVTIPAGPGDVDWVASVVERTVVRRLGYPAG